MLSTTFASPVNIQHVPTIARSRGQHVVNICSSHPPSDGLAQRALKIKPERLKNRSKSSKRRSKSLDWFVDSSYLRPWSGPTGNIFNICKATGRFNIQPCCQHLQRMVPTFQHQQLQRGRQRFPRWLETTKRQVHCDTGRDRRPAFEHGRRTVEKIDSTRGPQG